MKAFRFLAFALAIGIAAGAAVTVHGQDSRPVVPAVPVAPRAGATPPLVPADPTRGAPLRTQTPRVTVPQQAQEAPAPAADETRWRARRQPAIRLGQSYMLKAGEDVPGVVVIWGDVSIDGHVDQDVVNVLGSVTLGPTATVDGSVVAVGGNVKASAGTTIGGDLVIVGGGLEAPVEFSPQGDHVVVGSPSLGNTMRGVVPWVTHGLLWGRVITPGVGWVWWFVFVFLLIYLAIAFAFPKAVTASMDTLTKRPISAFFVGMLTLLLVGPVCALLAVSVIGVIVVPFVFCALVAAWMVGKTSVMRWMGAGIVHEESPAPHFQAIRSLVVGFALVTITYMIPVLGLAAWALVGMLGLGTATLTALATLRRERPVKPPKPAPPAPVEPAPSYVAPLSAPATYASTDPDLPLHPPAFVATPAPAPPAFVPGADAAHAVDLRSMPRATFLDRFFAGILDAGLVAIAVNLLPRGFFDYRGPDVAHFLMLLFVYHVAFWAWKGTTVGSIICNLRIIRVDGGALKPVDALVRGLSSLFSAAALGLGYFYIAIDSNRERQAWHDKIAGTLVVRVPKDWPLP